MGENSQAIDAAEILKHPQEEREAKPEDTEEIKYIDNLVKELQKPVLDAGLSAFCPVSMHMFK